MSTRGTRSPLNDSIVGRTRAGRRWVLLLVMLAISLPAQLFAQRMQDRPNAIEAERAIEQLRSPYCPGFMLEVCTSSQAAALRDSIFDLAAQGASTNDIVEWMIGRHGEEFRGVPQRSGAGLWAWVIPPFGILLALALVLAWLRANRSRHEALAVPESNGISEDDRQKLAAALREWEEQGEEGI
jgi:cytochrome c-type biogenesis protein CcmH